MKEKRTKTEDPAGNKQGAGVAGAATGGVRVAAGDIFALEFCVEMGSRRCDKRSHNVLAVIVSVVQRFLSIAGCLRLFPCNITPQQGSPPFHAVREAIWSIMKNYV